VDSLNAPVCVHLTHTVHLCYTQSIGFATTIIPISFFKMVFYHYVVTQSTVSGFLWCLFVKVQSLFSSTLAAPTPLTPTRASKGL